MDLMDLIRHEKSLIRKETTLDFSSGIIIFYSFIITIVFFLYKFSWNFLRFNKLKSLNTQY